MHLRIKYSPCCGLWPYQIWLAPASLAHSLSCFRIPPPFQAPSCLGPSWTSCFLSPAPVTLQVDSLIPVTPCWDPYTQGNCECRLSQSWKAEGNPSSLQSACKNGPLPSQVTNLGSLLYPPHHHQSTEPGAQYYLVSQTFHHDFIEMPLLACSISPCIWVYFWTLFFCSSSSS